MLCPTLSVVNQDLLASGGRSTSRGLGSLVCVLWSLCSCFPEGACQSRVALQQGGLGPINLYERLLVDVGSSEFCHLGPAVRQKRSTLEASHLRSLETHSARISTLASKWSPQSHLPPNVPDPGAQR